MHRDPFYKIHR